MTEGLHPSTFEDFDVLDLNHWKDKEGGLWETLFLANNPDNGEPHGAVMIFLVREGKKFLRMYFYDHGGELVYLALDGNSEPDKPHYKSCAKGFSAEVKTFYLNLWYEFLGCRLEGWEDGNV